MLAAAVLAAPVAALVALDLESSSPVSILSEPMREDVQFLDILQCFSCIFWNKSKRHIITLLAPIFKLALSFS